MINSESRAAGRPTDPVLTGRLLAAALKDLARSGFDRLSLDTLARTEKTSKQAIYRRYANKTALAQAAIEAALSAFVPPAPERTNPARDLSLLLNEFRTNVFQAPVGQALARLRFDLAFAPIAETLEQDLRFRIRQILIATAFERDMDTRTEILISWLWQNSFCAFNARSPQDEPDVDRVIYLVLGLGSSAA